MTGRKGVNKMTIAEMIIKLQKMKPFAEELKVGGFAIKYTGVDYGVRYEWDEADAMTDYNPFIWGVDLSTVVKLITKKRKGA
jgi:hypothetical protein